MKISVIITTMLIAQVSGSFFDVFQGAVLSVQNSFGKLFSDVVTDVKDTVDCTILAVEHVLSLSADATTRYYDKCGAGNKTTATPDTQQNGPQAVAITIETSNEEYLKREIPQEIDAKINETLSRLFHGYNPHDELEGVEKELARETARLSDISDLIKLELEKISSEIHVDFKNVEEKASKPSVDTILEELKLLEAIERNINDSTEANKIHQMIDNILLKLKNIEDSEAKENDRVDGILKHIENNTNKTYSDIWDQLNNWKKEEARHLDLIQNKMDEHDKSPEHVVYVQYKDPDNQSSKPDSTNNLTPVAPMRTSHGNSIDTQFLVSTLDSTPADSTYITLTPAPPPLPPFILTDISTLSTTESNFNNISGITDTGKSTLSTESVIISTSTEQNSVLLLSRSLDEIDSLNEINNEVLTNATILTMTPLSSTVPMTQKPSSLITEPYNTSKVQNQEANSTIPYSNISNTESSTSSMISNTPEVTTLPLIELTSTPKIVSQQPNISPEQISVTEATPVIITTSSYVNEDKQLQASPSISTESALRTNPSITTQKSQIRMSTQIPSGTLETSTYLPITTFEITINVGITSNKSSPVTNNYSTTTITIFPETTPASTTSKRAPETSTTTIKSIPETTLISATNIPETTTSTKSTITSTNGQGTTIIATNVPETTTNISASEPTITTISAPETTNNTVSVTTTTNSHEMISTTITSAPEMRNIDPPEITTTTTKASENTTITITSALESTTTTTSAPKITIISTTNAPVPITTITTSVLATTTKTITSPPETTTTSAPETITISTSAPKPATNSAPETITISTSAPKPATNSAPETTTISISAPKPATTSAPKTTTISTSAPKPATTSAPETTTISTSAPKPATTSGPETITISTSSPKPATISAPKTITISTSAPKPATTSAPETITISTSAPKPATTSAPETATNTTSVLQTSTPTTTIVPRPTTSVISTLTTSTPLTATTRISGEAITESIHANPRHVTDSSTTDKPKTTRPTVPTPSLNAFLNYIDRMMMATTPPTPITHAPTTSTTHRSKPSHLLPKFISSHNFRHPIQHGTQGLLSSQMFHHSLQPQSNSMHATISPLEKLLPLPPPSATNTFTSMLTPHNLPIPAAYNAPIPYARNSNIPPPPRLIPQSAFNQNPLHFPPSKNVNRPPDFFNRRPLQPVKPSTPKTNNFDDPDYDSFFHMPPKNSEAHQKALREARQLIANSKQAHHVINNFLNKKNKGINPFNLQKPLKIGK